MTLKTRNKFMKEAIYEAKRSAEEGGMPIGSVLVYNDEIIGKGRNQRNQKDSVILHAEMDAIENAGIRSNADDYEDMVLYTTLSPCQMCSGTIVYLGIPKVIIADNDTVIGAEDFLRNNGVEIEYMPSPEAKTMLRQYQEIE